MKLDTLIVIGDAIEKISSLTDTDVGDIIYSLEGICWDEEDAGDLIRYFEEGEFKKKTIYENKNNL